MLGLVLYFVDENPTFQLSFASLSSLLIMLYLIKIQPFNNSFLNKIELANEMSILLHIYIIFGFLDSNPDN